MKRIKRVGSQLKIYSQDSNVQTLMEKSKYIEEFTENSSKGFDIFEYGDQGMLRLPTPTSSKTLE